MVQRRPRGHIRERSNGKLQVLVYAGRDPVTGRQRYLAETVATRAEAERTLTRLLTRSTSSATPTLAPRSAAYWTAGSRSPTSS